MNTDTLTTLRDELMSRGFPLDIANAYLVGAFSVYVPEADARSILRNIENYPKVASA